MGRLYLEKMLLSQAILFFYSPTTETCYSELWIWYLFCIVALYALSSLPSIHCHFGVAWPGGDRCMWLFVEWNACVDWVECFVQIGLMHVLCTRAQPIYKWAVFVGRYLFFFSTDIIFIRRYGTLEKVNIYECNYLFINPQLWLLNLNALTEHIHVSAN